MEQLIPILMQLIGGAVGGNAVGAGLKNANLSALIRTILGIVGGVGGGQLASVLGILQTILGEQAGTGVEAVGNAGVGAVAGGLLTLIVGLIKQSTNKTQA